MKESGLQIDRVRAAIDYNKETGKFRWKVALSRRTSIGSEAGVIAGNKRRYIAIYGEKVLAHRLAFFIVNGVWPKGNVAPKNGNYDDIRWDNLVEETAADTARKSGARSTSKSGFKGVSWSPTKNKWVAVLTREYKRFHLGYFDTPEKASEKYQDALTGNIAEKCKEYSADEISKATKLRSLWNKTRKLYDVERLWSAFELFAEDVKDIEPDCDLVPFDASKPIGPENFKWEKRYVSPRREEGRSYRERNYIAVRGHELQKTFGISLEQYNQMHEAQNGVCEICGKPETATRNGKVKWLAVDHDHTTGEIRGLLCAHCNTAIGKLEDSIDVMESAIRYLKKYKSLAKKDQSNG